MRKGSKRPEDLTLGQLLAQVCRMTGYHVRQHMERIGLHRGQGRALFHLWHHDGVPQHELARAMRIRPASVTNMLQRMERDGWITRSRDEEDQRVVLVYLTDRAKDLRSDARKVFREMEAELAAIYSDEEQATLRRLLLKLHGRFARDAGDKPHHPPFFGHGEEASE